MNRELAAVARRFADNNSDRLNAAGATGHVIAQVKTTSPLVVTWRGGDVPAKHLASYTPGAGHTVLCALTDDNQLIALGQAI